MPFSSSSKDISLYVNDGLTYLSATCRTQDGDWNQSHDINLDWYIGFDSNGFTMTLVADQSSYEPGGEPFTKHMKPGTIKLKYNSILSGVLSDEYGGQEVSLCLDLCFGNVDGQLTYIPLCVCPSTPFQTFFFWVLCRYNADH